MDAFLKKGFKYCRIFHLFDLKEKSQVQSIYESEFTFSNNNMKQTQWECFDVRFTSELKPIGYASCYIEQNISNAVGT